MVRAQRLKDKASQARAGKRRVWRSGELNPGPFLITRVRKERNATIPHPHIEEREINFAYRSQTTLAPTKGRGKMTIMGSKQAAHEGR